MLDTLLLVLAGPLGILGATLALARLERALDGTRGAPARAVTLAPDEEGAAGPAAPG